MTVTLVAGKGSKDRGSGPGGRYWHIYEGKKRAGYVFINILFEPPIGRHASIHIHINVPDRGHGIGRQAYRLACQLSGHEEIYAHMRKSNIASRSAAEHAGFMIISEHPQLTMRWRQSE